MSAEAYFNRKVKVRNNVEELHFCTCVWFGGWFGTFETSSKALILSESPKYVKLDSLAYYYGMRVTNQVNFILSQINIFTSNLKLLYKSHYDSYKSHYNFYKSHNAFYKSHNAYYKSHNAFLQVT